MTKWQNLVVYFFVQPTAEIFFINKSLKNSISLWHRQTYLLFDTLEETVSHFVLVVLSLLSASWSLCLGWGPPRLSVIIQLPAAPAQTDRAVNPPLSLLCSQPQSSCFPPGLAESYPGYEKSSFLPKAIFKSHVQIPRSPRPFLGPLQSLFLACALTAPSLTVNCDFCLSAHQNRPSAWSTDLQLDMLVDHMTQDFQALGGLPAECHPVSSDRP